MISFVLAGTNLFKYAVINPDCNSACAPLLVCNLHVQEIWFNTKNPALGLTLLCVCDQRIYEQIFQCQCVCITLVYMFLWTAVKKEVKKKLLLRQDMDVIHRTWLKKLSE